MSEPQARPNDEVRGAPELEEDLEPTDKTAAEITGGDRPASSPNLADFSMTKTIDNPSPVVFGA